MENAVELFVRYLIVLDVPELLFIIKLENTLFFVNNYWLVGGYVVYVGLPAKDKTVKTTCFF